MHPFVSNQAFPSRSRLFSKLCKVVCPALILVGLVFVGGWWRTAHASGQDSGTLPALVDQGTVGIAGYVVGNGPVAAYTCPDAAKCRLKLTLNPGTVVLIVDNVVGGTVPGLNSNAWRKIVYQGLILYVPQVYIKVGAPSNGPDISLVQTSFEDDSTMAPGSTSGFTTSPSSQVTSFGGCGPQSPPSCFQGPICPPGSVIVGTFPGGITCCPQGYTFNSAANPALACIAPVAGVTRYTATDGRINGGAGDRIAIYCRKTGRIEVWSINDSQGHFLVEFSHAAVDAAGKAGFSVSIGAQGLVTIGGDGHGTYWAAIHGGPFHGTGAGDFAKTFQCYVTP